MSKPKLEYLLTILLILGLFLFKVNPASASDQPIQISPNMEGLIFNSPLLISQYPIASSLLFNSLPTQSPLYLQIQPASTTTSPPLSLESNLVAIIQPTESPTPSPTPQPPISHSTPSPTSKAFSYTPSKPGLNPDKIFDLVNNHRQTMGLALVQKNDQVCEVANSRAPELANEFATGNLHQGIRAMHLPYWNHENIIQTNSEQAALDGWLSDDIHRAGIEGNYKYSCVACSKNNCVQEFTNLVLK